MSAPAPTEPSEPCHASPQGAPADSPRRADELLSLVYAELRATAQAYLSRERPGHTLQATALVHEAYLKLAGPRAKGLENPAHFYAAAAEAMRRILVDHARAREPRRSAAGPTRGGRRSSSPRCPIRPRNANPPDS